MADLLIPAPPLAGQLRAIHYAFMPNRRHYCGIADPFDVDARGFAGAASYTRYHLALANQTI